MNLVAIKTRKITHDAGDIFSILDEALPSLSEGCVVAVTSKIVSICEGSTRPFGETSREELIKQQAERWLPSHYSKYGRHLTITNHTLISSAGIDESNGEGYYILWPADAQKTANDIRKYLDKKHGLERVGVVITDSISQPLRRGATGIALAHSGFKALHNYVGSADLFGRPFVAEQANISGGLAVAAVLAMGEGAVQTPLCVISDVPFVEFVPHDPSPAELAEITIELEDDLYAPLLASVDWHRGPDADHE